MKYALSRALAPRDCSAVTPHLGGADDARGTEDRFGRGCTETRPPLPELPPAAADRAAPGREARGSVVRPRAGRRAHREATTRTGAKCPLGVAIAAGQAVLLGTLALVSGPAASGGVS